MQFVSFNSHFIFNGYIIWPPTSRYVADATPFSLRTAASAAFAMATALGAALGPGMAILLNRMDEFEFHLPFLEQQYFNGMTAPGYFMALSWFIYTLCILFFFGEPTRSGLDELRKREEATIGGRSSWRHIHHFDGIDKHSQLAQFTDYSGSNPRCLFGLVGPVELRTSCSLRKD